MICKKCHREIPDAAHFCTYCGTKVEAQDVAETGEPVAEVANEAVGVNVAESAAVEATSEVSAGEIGTDEPSSAEETPATTANDEVAPAIEQAQDAPTDSPSVAPQSNAASYNEKYATADAAPESPEEKAAKKKKLMIGGAIAAVAIIVIIALFSYFSSQITGSLVKSSLEQSSTFSSGLVSNDYTSSPAYTFSDVNVTSQEKIDNSFLLALYGGNSDSEIRRVEFSGKMKNEFFETKFTGEAYYINTSGKWKLIDGPTKKSATTKPLRGISTFQMMVTSAGSSSNSSEEDYTFDHSNFSSDLVENNGTYTSHAKCDVDITYWFGKDTGTVVQDFIFDSDKGWTLDGDCTFENQKTEYTLSGKSFEYTESIYFGSQSPAVVDFTFGDCPNADDVSVSYSIDKPSSGDNYVTIDLEGTATGTIAHEFGKAYFSMNVSDSDNKVVFSGSSSSKQASLELGI